MAWDFVPEPLLFSILKILSHKDVVRAGFVCKRWHTVATDNLLWKKIFCRDFKISLKTKLRPGANFWKCEYKRLVDNTPTVLSEELRGHQDEVLHVSFSNSGNHFVTCSKDGYLMVWNIDKCGMTSLRYSKDMKTHSWNFTWASKFNANDTMLLVAGVISDINGEIAIFECTDVGDFVSKSFLK